MKFAVSLKNAAGQNTPKAQIRECTRLASIAYCLARFPQVTHTKGVSARIVSAPAAFMQSERWRFFRHLYDPDWKGNVSNVPAEVAQVGGGGGDVGFKCSIDVHHDETYLKQFRMVVAHEYDERFYRHERLLPVPFFVHDRVVEALIRYGVFEAYLKNDIGKIRKAFRREDTHKYRRLLGWCGATMWKGRRDILKKAPHWLLVEGYESAQKMDADDHIRWLGNMRGALALPGDTPKTNLPPLLAMMGFPIVMYPIKRYDTPPIDDSNAVMVDDWEQVRLTLKNVPELQKRAAKATQDYLDSWSPQGQARLIIERMRSCTR